jgi:hypothetical protein
MRNIFCFAFLFCISLISFSQVNRNIERSQLPDSLGKDSTLYSFNNISYLYTRPKIGSFLINAGKDFLSLPLELPKKENRTALVSVAALTGISLYYDQKIILTSQKFGKYIGLKNDVETYNLSPIKGIPLYVPASIGTSLYFIGDGTTELAIDGSFYLYGLINNDNRALRTSCELSEGIITVGIYVQLLKHLTGHEDPTNITVSGGKWRFFNSLHEYYSCVPSYDAFPSGHLATAMMTVTVLSMNYPEYTFIKPIGYSLMAICGYQMLNIGVHWMSDYPLAIAMGYAVGRTIVNKGRINVVNNSDNAMHQQKKIKPVFNVQPVYMGYGTAGISCSLMF